MRKIIILTSHRNVLRLQGLNSLFLLFPSMFVSCAFLNTNLVERKGVFEGQGRSEVGLGKITHLTSCLFTGRGI